MATNFIREYLIKLGVDVSSAELSKLENKLSTFDKGIIGFFKRINHASVLVAKSYLSLMKSIQGFASGIAQADMNMQKWAKSMYLSTNSAKALDRTLSAMGIGLDELQDVALNPELTRQYKELLNLSTQLVNSLDVSASMRGIRSINFEFQKMGVIWASFKERVVHYMWKFFESTAYKGFMKNLQAFNKWGMNNMDKIAKFIGDFIGGLVNMFANLVNLGRLVYTYVIEPFVNFFKSLPEVSQQFIKAFATIGLAVAAGPFGKILLMVQKFLELIEDYMVWKSGGESYLGDYYKKLFPEEDPNPPKLEDMTQAERVHKAARQSRIDLAMRPETSVFEAGMIGAMNAWLAPFDWLAEKTIGNQLDKMGKYKQQMDEETYKMLGWRPGQTTVNSNSTAENNYHIYIKSTDPKGSVDEMMSQIRNYQTGVA